jgi:phosphate transport system substrate-binding protein
MTRPTLQRLASSCVAGVTLLMLAACGNSGGPSHRINVSGSTSVSPFAEHLAELYQKQHAGESINVQSLGSSAGIQAATEGVAEIGMSSRELKTEEAEKLDELIIARDGLAVIVHPENPIAGLTQAQVQGIFSGTITNWKDVGGIDHSITLVVREAGSGTYSAFEELMMKGLHTTPNALRQGSNGAIRQVVAEDPNAVGYISIGIVDNTVKAINIDTVQPTIDNVRNNVYKFARNFLFVWPKGKQLDALSQDYVDYVMSEEGQAELERLGLVRVK